jgi:hypothetical protein
MNQRERRRVLVAVVLAGLSAGAVAAPPWEFSAPIAVTTTQGETVFHQLESSGRSNLAVAGGTVAVVWEDNRSSLARVYVAFKAAAADRFEHEQPVSVAAPAYEPVVVALGEDLFLFGWEEDGEVWVRAGAPSGLGPPLRLSRQPAGQVHLAVSAAGEIQAVWAERRGAFSRILAAALRLSDDRTVQAGAVRPVDAAAPRQDQSYPVVAWPRPGVRVVVWEDRRHGHTVLMDSRAGADGKFSAPRQLNERPPRRSQAYGRGTGVARVGLAVPGDDRLVAAWLDKRDFEGGYDLYAAYSSDGGRHFGRNQKVQDRFGDAFGQWHGAVAANRNGALAAVWDDDRDETSDVWLAWPQDGGWSENLAVPGASGPGQQRSPVAALDAAGDLHLAWIEERPAGGTRLLYLRGRYGAR